ncbi:MAG TPA: hypothetical protein VI136_17675 [Verrucomicrobiae bacterium]
MELSRARRGGEPIGSGFVEASGRQGQSRFKRTGQFWSTTGHEALVCRETFWRRERYALLFLHTAHVPSKS